MFMLKKHLLMATLSSLLITGCAQQSELMPLLPKGNSQTITVLHTNDNHGRFWHNKRGEYGMAARKTLIDKLRADAIAKGHKVILLSGGDINTGVPESDIQDAEPDFMGMNAMEYDAMAVGNHEFDNPIEVIKKQQKWAKFPFLSANIYNRNTGKRLFEASHFFDYNNLRIAVIGLTTDDTIRIGNPEYLSNIEFRSPIEEAKKLVPSLRKQADLIIAVTHMGHYQNGKNTVNAPGDVALARAVPGIDLIVGGHSQEPVCMKDDKSGQYDPDFAPGKTCIPDQQNGAWIVQAFEWGKYVGKAVLTVQKDQVTLDSYQLLPVNLKVKKKDASGKTVKDENGDSIRVFATQEIQADPGLKALLQPYQEKGEAGLNVTLGNSDGKFEGDRNQIRFNPTNLGFLVAESQRIKANADVAVMNSGGIRDSLAAGHISYKDVLTIQPFGNTVCSLTLNGTELLEYLSIAASKPVDTGAYAQFAGVDITIRDNTLIDAKINGQSIDPESEYTLALNSFLASGGDGYPKMNDREGFVNTGFVDADALRAFIESNSPLAIADYAPSNVKRD